MFNVEAFLALAIVLASATCDTFAEIVESQEFPDFSQLKSLDDEFSDTFCVYGESVQHRSGEDDSDHVRFKVAGKEYVLMFVLDGHGAPMYNPLVTIVKENLPRLVFLFLREGMHPEEAIERSHDLLHGYAMKKGFTHCGVCTAGALIYPQDEKCVATCFNTGDASVICVRDEKSQENVSTPHKYRGDPIETSRLKELQKNGKVVIDSNGRLRNPGMQVGYGIMVSNAIGDTIYPFISWKPHTRTIELHCEDKLFAVTDGITDFVNSFVDCHSDSLPQSAYEIAKRMGVPEHHIDDMSYVKFTLFYLISEQFSVGNETPFSL
jgi:serine/threonine protein phosphatase PrpC